MSQSVSQGQLQSDRGSDMLAQTRENGGHNNRHQTASVQGMPLGQNVTATALTRSVTTARRTGVWNSQGTASGVFGSTVKVAASDLP